RQGLDARTGHRLYAVALRRIADRRHCRSRALHRHSEPGGGLQGRVADHPAVAQTGRGPARTEVRHPRISRPDLEQRRASADDPRSQDRPLDRSKETKLTVPSFVLLGVPFVESRWIERTNTRDGSRHSRRFDGSPVTQSADSSVRPFAVEAAEPASAAPGALLDVPAAAPARMLFGLTALALVWTAVPVAAARCIEKSTHTKHRSELCRAKPARAAVPAPARKPVAAPRAMTSGGGGFGH